MKIIMDELYNDQTLIYNYYREIILLFSCVLLFTMLFLIFVSVYVSKFMCVKSKTKIKQNDSKQNKNDYSDGNRVDPIVEPIPSLDFSKIANMAGRTYSSDVESILKSDDSYSTYDNIDIYEPLTPKTPREKVNEVIKSLIPPIMSPRSPKNNDVSSPPPNYYESNSPRYFKK